MDDPFYAEGLRFACSKCSSCCRGGPGYVFLSKTDISRILSFLSLDFPDFFRKYATIIDTGMGLTLSFAEKEDYDCIFWTERGCSIYDARPVQCSTYPFWSTILATAEDWTAEGRRCPGIGRGELRTRTYIQERLYERRAAGTLILEYGTNPESINADTILGR